MLGRAIDLGVAAPALLVGQGTGVADAGGGQAVADARGGILVGREPRDRADGSRNEEETVRVPPRYRREQLRQSRQERDSGEVVVCQRRMAAVSGEEDLVGRGPRQE